MGKVHLYTDADILTELKAVYGAGASSMYTTMLEKSCNTFNQGFFSQYFGALKGLPESVSDSEFLSELAKCDGAIPSQNGLGEKKTYVLIQMMDVLHPGSIYVFCSDDFPARQSFNSIPVTVPCLSILRVFQLLKEKSYTKEKMQPYFDSLSGFWPDSSRPPIASGKTAEGYGCLWHRCLKIFTRTNSSFIRTVICHINSAFYGFF